MREHCLCAIFKLYTNSSCWQRVGLEVLIKVTAEPIPVYLSLTSELWLRPWVWSNCWVSSEFLYDLNPLKNEVKWLVGGLPSMTALCVVLRELSLTCFHPSFFFYCRECVEHHKFELLYYSTCMKCFQWKIVKKTAFLKTNRYLKPKNWNKIPGKNTFFFFWRKAPLL